MRIIFLGPPGVGKGTMAARIHEVCDIPHISTGQIFRDNVKRTTAFGLEVQTIMARGELVPDDITVAMVKDRLQNEDASQGFILDGFPRTIPQAEAFAQYMVIDHVINLVCSTEELVKRLTGRRFCSNCKRIYNIFSMPPLKDDLCDDDSAILKTREDDKPEAVEKRLSVYHESTEPLITWYKKQGLTRNIDAGRTPDKVFEEIEKILKTAIDC